MFPKYSISILLVLNKIHLIYFIIIIIIIINHEILSNQVLRYETGQKYVTHHDFGQEDNSKPCGPRILTFFLYLSDVEEGWEVILLCCCVVLLLSLHELIN